MRCVFLGFLVFLASGLLLLPQFTGFALPAGSETILLLVLMVLGMGIQVDAALLVRQISRGVDRK